MILIILMLFSKQARRRPTWSSQATWRQRAPCCQHGVGDGDPCLTHIPTSFIDVLMQSISTANSPSVCSEEARDGHVHIKTYKYYVVPPNTYYSRKTLDPKSYDTKCYERIWQEGFWDVFWCI